MPVVRRVAISVFSVFRTLLPVVVVCCTVLPAASAGAVESMTVTAQRRPQPVLTLVGNVARLGGPEIERVNAAHPAEILNRLPGVYLHRGNGQEHLTAIRSPVLTGGAGAGSFLYLEDGVPLRAAGFANVNGLFEATSEIASAVEVVRGPGSALYGSNAVHGLINILTRGPETGPAASLEVSAASFQRYGAKAFVADGKSGAGTALAIALGHEGGYVSDAGLDQQKAVLRHERRIPGGAVVATLSGSNLNQETAGFIRGFNAYKDRELARANPNPEAYRDTKALRLVIRYERPLGDRSEVIVTPYARWNEMEFLQHFLPSKAEEKNGHWSLGALVSQRRDLTGGHSVVLGIDSEFTEGWLSEVQQRPSIGSFPQGVHYDYTVTSQVLAPYLQSEWQLRDDLRLSAGVRYEWTRYDYTTDAPPGLNGRYVVPSNRSDTFETLTPKLGLSWQVGPETAFYGSYVRGARAPQTTDVYRLQGSQDVGEIEEEALDSLELGARRLGERVAFALAVFAMEKRNFFFRDADGFNVPDGHTRHIGVEIDGEFWLTQGLRLSGSATYARHTYRFDRLVAANATESIASGDEIDTAPNRLANVRLLWRPLKMVDAEAEWVHVGRYYTDAANDHVYPGHDIYNLRLSARLNEDWTLSATVRNCLDTDYAERADFSFGTDRYFPGEARSAEVRLRYSR